MKIANSLTGLMRNSWNWVRGDKSKTQIIFLGACILSYTHTLNLFARSGYDGILSHIGTIICELMFFMGVTSKRPNAGTRFALFFGGAIVLYSNVSYGLANGKPIVFYEFPNGMQLNEVILCGGLIPCIVWVSDWVAGKLRSLDRDSHRENAQVIYEDSQVEVVTHEKQELLTEDSQEKHETHTDTHKTHMIESETHTDAHEIHELEPEAHADAHETHTDTREKHTKESELTDEESEVLAYAGMTLDKIIEEYKKKHKELPSISKLVTLSGKSEWTCRKALKPYRRKSA